MTGDLQDEKRLKGQLGAAREMGAAAGRDCRLMWRRYPRRQAFLSRILKIYKPAGRSEQYSEPRQGKLLWRVFLYPNLMRDFVELSVSFNFCVTRRRQRGDCCFFSRKGI